MTAIGQQVQDLTKGVVPVMFVVLLAGVIFQAGVTYNGLQSGSSVTQAQIDGIKSSISNLEKAVQKISDTVRAGPTNILTRTDMYRFCLFAERNNKGFRCPDIWTTE